MQSLLNRIENGKRQQFSECRKLSLYSLHFTYNYNLNEIHIVTINIIQLEKRQQSFLSVVLGFCSLI
jgi:hypothetical protein